MQYPCGFGGIGTDELAVCYAVCKGVLLCVFDCLGDDLDADYLLCRACHGKPDRARSAVQIKHGFSCGIGKVTGGGIQLFGGRGVYLIE